MSQRAVDNSIFCVHGGIPAPAVLRLWSVGDTDSRHVCMCVCVYVCVCVCMCVCVCVCVRVYMFW